MTSPFVRGVQLIQSLVFVFPPEKKEEKEKDCERLSPSFLVFFPGLLNGEERGKGWLARGLSSFLSFTAR